MNKQNTLISRFLEKYLSLTIEGTRDWVRGVYGILAGIIGDSSKIEYGMTSILKFKRARGLGGGKDPNKKINLVEHQQCRAYSTNVIGDNRKLNKVSEELSEQHISSKSNYHPTGYSAKDGWILQTNYTHSARVEGNRTVPVGKDHKGRDSYVVGEIIAIDVSPSNISKMPLERALLFVDLLKDFAKEFNLLQDCNPTTDLKLTNARIGFVARSNGYEWDESVETKEEVIKKLELIIEDVERIIKSNENNNKDNN